MTNDERLSKLVQDFSLLPEEKQNYILGILRALAFACYGEEESSCAETCSEEAGI